jgi:hypothetical protein
MSVADRQEPTFLGFRLPFVRRAEPKATTEPREPDHDYEHDSRDDDLDDDFFYGHFPR